MNPGQRGVCNGVRSGPSTRTRLSSLLEKLSRRRKHMKTSFGNAVFLKAAQ